MKKLLVTFVLLLVAIMFSAAAYAAVTIPATTITGKQGDTITKDITITNTGNASIANLLVSVSRLTKGSDTLSTVTISPTSITNLDADATQVIHLSITVPLTQTIGDYSGTITINDTTSNVVYTGSVALTVTQKPSTVALTLPSEIILGSDTQDRDTTISESFTITNTGTSSVDDIAILAQGIGSKYDLVVAPSTITSLAPGSSQEIIVTSKVPLDQDSGISTLGTLRITGTAQGQSVSQTTNVKMETQSTLEIRKVRVTVEDGDTSSLDDGDDFEAKPGDKVTLEVEIKNTDSEYRIEDIDVDISGDDLDVDETESVSRLKDGAKDTIEISFTIDSDIDEDTYTIDITAQGTDENEASQEDSWTIDADVQRNSHDLSIRDVQITPSTLGCEKTGRIDFTIRNIGSSDEDDVMIEVSSDEIPGFFQRLRGIKVNQDRSVSKSVAFTIPNDFNRNVGKVWFSIKPFYDGDNELDEELVSMDVGTCGTTSSSSSSGSSSSSSSSGGSTTTGTGSTTTGTTTTTTTDNFPTTGNVVYGKPKSAFTDSLTYLVLLGFAALLIIVLIVVLIIKAMK
jgi:uncharacterized membrane protein